MQLDDLFHMLAYGELSNHYAANADDGTIRDEKKNQIISHVNDGLMRLYTKFLLSQKEEEIALYDYDTAYTLLGDSPKTSLDVAKRPTYKLINLISVSSNKGIVRTINDLNDYWSVNVKSHNVLAINTTYTDEVLVVIYQASHPRIQNTDNGNKVIELPEVLNGALTAYVAYKMYSGMNTAESVTLASGYLAMFNTVCAEVLDTDALNLSTGNTSNKFDSRGWI